MIFVLQRLLNSTLRQGSLRASFEADPTSAILQPPPHDSALPLPQLIRTLLLCSTKAHLYELHPLLTSLLSLSIHSPSITSAYIPSKRNSITEVDSVRFRGLPDGFLPGIIGRGTGRRGEDVEDVLELVLKCLKKVGEEIGAI